MSQNRNREAKKIKALQQELARLEASAKNLLSRSSQVPAPRERHFGITKGSGSNTLDPRPRRDEQPQPPVTPQLGSVGRAQDEPTLARVHPEILGACAYAAIVEPIAPSGDWTGTVVRRFLAEVHPKDALERLAALQALLTYGRYVRLAKLAMAQTDLDAIQILNEAADRAANVYRRLMVGIAEYRRPAESNVPLAIQQANIAQQQVVQNVERPALPKKKVTNELGTSKNEPQFNSKTVSALPSGTEIAAALHPARATVGPKHRTQDGRRKSSGRTKRL